MTTFAQAESALRSRFKTLVTDAHSLLTAHDNAPFTEPDSGPWCRFNVMEADSFQASIGAPGANRFRNPGLVMVQLFDDLTNGTGALIDLVDIIVPLFRSQVVGGIVFQTPSVKKIGGTQGEKWYQINVTIPYYFDQV